MIGWRVFESREVRHHPCDQLAQRQGGFLVSITHQVDVGTQLDGVAGAIDLL